MITDVQLGDQVHREVTVFFSDIRDYTGLSEIMSPEENFDFIMCSCDIDGRHGQSGPDNHVDFLSD